MWGGKWSSSREAWGWRSWVLMWERPASRNPPRLCSSLLDVWGGLHKSYSILQSNPHIYNVYINTSVCLSVQAYTHHTIIHCKSNQICVRGFKIYTTSYNKEKPSKKSIRGQNLRKSSTGGIPLLSCVHKVESHNKLQTHIALITWCHICRAV